jgi:hypothetical protein
MPLKIILSIFWEVVDFTQYAKSLFMVMVDPLLLVISIPSSLAFGFVNPLNDLTEAHTDSDGLTGVGVGTTVFVDVEVAVLVGVGVFVGRGVLVGLVFVRVAVSVGFFVGVLLGSTTGVYVGGSVGEEVRVIVGVGTAVGVDVISACI